MKCPYCDSKRVKKIYSISEYQIIPSGLTRSNYEIFYGFQCISCLSVVNKNHSKPNYTLGYYSRVSYGREKPSYDYTGSLIKSILKYSEGNALEIGAAGGNVARLLRDLGLNVEIVEPDIGYSRKLIEDNFKVYEDISEVKKKYKVIYSIAVLEHVSEVLDFISSCIGRLEENGFLILQYPNVNSLSARINLKNWDMLYEPGHLSIPSELGLSMQILNSFKNIKMQRKFSSTILSRGRVPFMPHRITRLEYLYSNICRIQIFGLINKILWSILDIFNLGETIVIIYQKND
jgi:hypothetical protein